MSSIQRKLSVSLAIGITLLWLLASVVSSLIIHHELEEAADSALRVTARQLLAIGAVASEFSVESEAVTEMDSRTVSGTKSKPESGSGTESLRTLQLRRAQQAELSAGEGRRMEEVKGLLGYVIRDAGGAALVIGGKLPQTLLVQKIPSGFSSIEGYRVYIEQSVVSQRSILIAEPLEHRNEINQGAIIVLSLSLLLLIPLSLLLVWWVVRGSMHEVESVQQDIESRGGNDLSVLATTDMPRELVPIVESVNRLLGRLSRTLESERNFTTNSAHELRTPIASALAQTQRQIASLPDGTERERARRIEQTLQELARTSEKLMQLARAESGSMINDVPTNAFPIIEYLLDEYKSLRVEASRLQLYCITEAQFHTVLDPDGVAILLRNLIDNALKHGAANSTIEVVVDSEPNEIRVINSGPVIPAAELQGLKERFKRYSSGTDGNGAEVADHVDIGPTGSGLGLAIAETIAGHAGITLTLQSPARGRSDGFEAILSAGWLQTTRA
ncbi:sensor histidine kinase [Granulosicoccus antarcticus]|uniref:histidine kinase n=1 Tax=Granulosicoccus antarcticus IMCC3135 TaxID=1192854 RepID=A0A2Z2NIF0_9GAMM|nr:ATP-binding protein [Granulosicoccus antarcticus]ASJ70255.1 Sensor protein QseC [Granulosicoccus antarcticus IMCC3135]